MQGTSPIGQMVKLEAQFLARSSHWQVAEPGMGPDLSLRSFACAHMLMVRCSRNAEQRGLCFTEGPPTFPLLSAPLPRSPSLQLLKRAGSWMEPKCQGSGTVGQVPWPKSRGDRVEKPHPLPGPLNESPGPTTSTQLPEPGCQIPTPPPPGPGAGGWDQGW